MTSVTKARRAQPLPPFIVAVLALTGMVCAALAWWLARAAGAGMVASGLSAALVVLPLTAAVLALLRHDRALRRAQASLTRTHGQIEAQEQAFESVRKDREWLVAALDDLPIGVAVFDRQDRLLLNNRFMDQLIPGLPNAREAPMNQQDLLRREQALGVQPHASLLQYPDDRWVQALLATSDSGITVVARADVTELVRAHHRAAAANAQLVRQSTTDGLTGITNRRQFDETLELEWHRAARTGTCLSLLIVDIDHFKRFNDHYGHVAGDECLRQVARLLQTCVRRAGELVARYGGEEFVILLPGTDLAPAEELAQRCLAGIARIALPHASSPTAPHVTFSIGIAQTCPAAAQDPATLVNAADTAMYRAKTAGRARYAIADQADWEIDKDAPRSKAGDLN